jgi:O-antigen ligase
LVLGLVALLGVGFIWPGAGVAALGTLLGRNTLPGRLDLLRNTVTLARDYPFIGAGMGGFHMLYSTYALLIHVVYTVHSHTFFLDLAVEQGILAVVVLVGMWLVFGWSVWQEMSRSEARRGSRTLGAAALSLIVILLHGLVDNVLYSSAVLFLFMPLAFAGSLPRGLERHTRRRTLVALAISVIVLLVMAFVWRDPLFSRLASNLGVIHQSQAELGVYSWPEWPIQDEVRRQVNLEQPVAEFEQALALDPRNATANRRLGMIELSLGDYEAALGHLEAAYAAEPWSHTTRQLLGEAYLANGRLEEGRALWDGLSNAQQQLDHRVWWYQYIGDTERAEWMRQAARGQQ